VLLRRIENHVTNSDGESPEERELVLRDLAEVEPLLRRTCTVEIDARQVLMKNVHQLAELGRDTAGQG
jgi:hypothetical protein